jgi:hypothetical protein
MAAAGSPIRPAWDTPPSRWLLDYIACEDPLMGGPDAFSALSLLDRSENLLIEERGYFFGTNMAIRRDVLFEVGGFNPEAYGQTWLGDGETGLVFELWARGLQIG